MILFDADLTLERPCTTGRVKTDRSPLLVSVTAWKGVTGHLHIDPHRLCRYKSKTASCDLLPGIGSKTPPQAFLQLSHHTLKVILYLTSSFMSGFHLCLLLPQTDIPFPTVCFGAVCPKAEFPPSMMHMHLETPKLYGHTLLN